MTLTRRPPHPDASPADTAHGGRPWVRRLAVVGVAGLFAWAIWGLYHGGPRAVVGEPAPGFTLATPSGAEVTLSRYRGKVVLLNFFTTWCVPCQQEIPQIVAFRRTAGPGLVVIGIDRMEPGPTVAAFARREHMAYPIGLDRSGRLSQTYGVTGQPESFWIDARGILRLHVVGPMTPGLMRATYSALSTRG